MSIATLNQVDLTGRGTHILIWAYIVASSILAISSIDEVATPWPTIVGIFVLLSVGVMLTADESKPLRRSSAIVAGLAWAGVALATTWHVQVAGGHSQWYFGAGTVTMFLLALRGRVGFAWLGFLAQSAVIVAWGYTTDIGVVEALVLVGKQVPILLVGTLFTVGLRRTDATIRRLGDQTSARAMIEAAQVASTTERNARLKELDLLATPLLARLTDERPITESERLEFAVVEAELRDGLRARALTLPSVVEAARSARRRGVEVMLLDDRYPDEPDAATLASVVRELQSVLDAATRGRVVARLLPVGRPEAATILSDTGDHQEHRDVPHAAEPSVTKGT